MILKVFVIHITSGDAPNNHFVKLISANIALKCHTALYCVHLFINHNKFSNSN